MDLLETIASQRFFKSPVGYYYPPLDLMVVNNFEDEFSWYGVLAEFAHSRLSSSTLRIMSVDLEMGGNLACFEALKRPGKIKAVTNAKCRLLADEIALLRLTKMWKPIHEAYSSFSFFAVLKQKEKHKELSCIERVKIESFIGEHLNSCEAARGFYDQLVEIWQKYNDPNLCLIIILMASNPDFIDLKKLLFPESIKNDFNPEARARTLIKTCLDLIKKNPSQRDLEIALFRRTESLGKRGIHTFLEYLKKASKGTLDSEGNKEIIVAPFFFEGSEDVGPVSSLVLHRDSPIDKYELGLGNRLKSSKAWISFLTWTLVKWQALYSKDGKSVNDLINFEPPPWFTGNVETLRRILGSAETFSWLKKMILNDPELELLHHLA